MQDILRYVLTATCPETKDNDFTWKEFQTRNNSELVAIYGNFTNRVLSLIDKYYEGKIPNPKIVNDSDNETSEAEAETHVSEQSESLSSSVESSKKDD